MEPVPLLRRAGAELLGTALLTAVTLGSAAMAQKLSTDAGLRLLEGSLATMLGLGALILLFGPVSGGHLNPAVSLTDAVLSRRGSGRGLRPGELGVYVLAQVIGAVLGALLVNVMFEVPAGLGTVQRATLPALLGEAVATAGLVLLIVGLVRAGRSIMVVATAVGAYIGAAFWFTSSTAFANPAVTVGRLLTDSAGGIAPASFLPFLLAQLIGTGAGIALAVLLFPHPRTPGTDVPLVHEPEAVADAATDE
ncbi:aquaporin [Microbacterium sp. KUDC0406]|uniref:aquaporin n=1 Tax=Microbacterium sp. KUDC0406 TaxID=2909588 RepID=UPI001F161155|nr:aquaporin [Microbacterium sp. KUDC0406]UJP10346.1 aquaporin [Microbacterium sp. KUDC0406]